MEELLSSEDCTKILQNRFKNTDIQFIKYEIKPISEHVEGVMGEHYNLLIDYRVNKTTNTKMFFIKTKPRTSESQIEWCDEHEAYKKEIFIYDILLKEFNKYGYNTKFAAKCYYTIPDRSIVLENLVNEGYVLPELQIFFSLNQIKCALKSLALFHAAGFAYQETKTKELGYFNFEEEFKEYLNELHFMFFMKPERYPITMKWWTDHFKSINKLIDLLPKDTTYKTKFKDMFNNFPFGKSFVEKTNLAKTIGHSDLWSNNLLFKYENNEVVDCRLLDFQMCRYFYPSFDVFFLIFMNTSSEFRDVHLNELFEYYYSILGNMLDTYGYSVESILPKDDFYESIRLTRADALLHVICAKCESYLPKELLTSLVKDNNGEGLQEFIGSSSIDCCEAFRNNDEYRKIISDILEHLRSSLLELQSSNDL